MAAATDDASEGQASAPAAFDIADYSRLTAAHAQAVVRYDAAMNLRNTAMLTNAALTVALRRLSDDADEDALAKCAQLTEMSEKALGAAAALWKQVAEG